jgi:proteasome lid subunit RPN8/RPN11
MAASVTYRSVSGRIGASTLRIPESEMMKITAHAKQTYPEECCGILVGRFSDERKIREAIPTQNLSVQLRSRRYSIDPKEIWAAEKKYETDGMGVVGFYHSHPDAPARPSAFDLENAWVMYSYLIASVTKGDRGAFSSWILKEDRSTFIEEDVIVES